MRKLQFTAQHGQQQDVNESGVVPVSYTHLTLPTTA